MENGGKSDRDPVIRVEDVTRVFQDNGVAVHALRGVTFSVHRGEFTAIVGPSGSGKTTLLHVIAGLDRPTAGVVSLAGRRVSTMSGRELSDFRRDHVGFIFQSYNLVPVLTVAENVEYIMLLQGVPHRERRRRVAAMLDSLGLAGLAERFPMKLSGGQQQRVAVARAMVTEPDLILADEPTANLDSQTGAGLLDMMRALNRNTGMTFVFSTHDPMIMARADRIITLTDGRVARDETKEVVGK